jgi:hypothetical protein
MNTSHVTNIRKKIVLFPHFFHWDYIIFFLGNMRNFGNFWEILGKFRKFWENLGNFGNIWENWGKFGNF